jgi:hypothetical protein
MKKYNEMNSSEDSFNVEDLSFQVEEETIRSISNFIQQNPYTMKTSLTGLILTNTISLKKSFTM